MLDLEVSLMEPVLQWLPYESKSTLQRYGSWLWSPFIYSSMFHGQLILRETTPKIINEIMHNVT
ncbi:unnamed protein product [Timema podura]|uniref:Uncharacterized protein n=1 Tax=Timema podura TaxID=61482 RepID=A0ABN7NCY5_TIMPD|nr:unnamed protein product [Timema podura]